MRKSKKTTIKATSPEIGLLKKIRIAVNELNDVKAGKIKAKDFDDLLNEL